VIGLHKKRAASWQVLSHRAKRLGVHGAAGDPEKKRIKTRQSDDLKKKADMWRGEAGKDKKSGKRVAKKKASPGQGKSGVRGNRKPPSGGMAHTVNIGGNFLFTLSSS